MTSASSISCLVSSSARDYECTYTFPIRDTSLLIQKTESPCHKKLDQTTTKLFTTTITSFFQTVEALFTKGPLSEANKEKLSKNTKDLIDKATAVHNAMKTLSETEQKTIITCCSDSLCPLEKLMKKIYVATTEDVTPTLTKIAVALRKPQITEREITALFNTICKKDNFPSLCIEVITAIETIKKMFPYTIAYKDEDYYCMRYQALSLVTS